MKINKRYDIFISYRHDDGDAMANLIAVKLRNAGYNVFLDVETMRAGKFNEQLYSVIKHCKDFILILPKNGLDRCLNEADWVRQEIIHAMKHKKNIIPVMLRDFTFPETIPAELEELRNYQGVAAGDYNFFGASIEKLKIYLKSKRGFTWQRYKMQISAAALLLLAAAGVFLWKAYQERQYFANICIEQANLMSAGIATINHNLNVAKSAHDEWSKLRSKLSRAKPQDVSTVKQEFIAWMENQKKSIQPANPELKISDENSNILKRHGIKVSEIIAFYSMALPRDVEDAAHYLSQLQAYANEDYIAEVYDKFAHLNYQFLEASGKSTYYYFLGLLTTMPQNVYEDFYKMRQYLNNFSEIPLTSSFEDYESQGDAMLKKAEDIVMEMGSIVNTEDRDVENLQNQLNDIIEKIDENKKKKDEAAEQEIAQRISNTKKLSTDVIERRQQLQEMEEKIEASTRNIIEKCKLSAEDDQYLMWGKIVRIATAMARTATRRMESERLNRQDKDAAQAKGFDVSSWFTVKYSLTMDEVLQEITARLDQYMKYFPDTKGYVPAVKQFYAEVKNGKQALCGMVVMGTKDNIPHPVFRIGDIVLSRNDKTVNSIDDYKAAKETPGDDTLTFLRMDGVGLLVKQTEKMPPTDVLVGFMGLKE
jgi:hypothetical protein